MKEYLICKNIDNILLLSDGYNNYLLNKSEHDIKIKLTYKIGINVVYIDLKPYTLTKLTNLDEFASILFPTQEYEIYKNDLKLYRNDIKWFIHSHRVILFKILLIITFGYVCYYSNEHPEAETSGFKELLNMLDAIF